MVHSPFAIRHDQSLAFILVVAIHFIAGYGLWQTLRHISPPVIVPAQPLQVELLTPHSPTPVPQPVPKPTQSAKPNPPPKPQPKPVRQPKAAQPKPHHHKEVKKVAHKPKVVHKPKTAPLKADHHKAVSKKIVHEPQSAPAREAPQASQAPEPPEPTAPPSAASIHPAAPSEQTASAPPAMRREPVVYNADYLRNPAPIYPRLSRRLGETGKVLLQVFVDSNGRAEKVKIKVSSGYERLDEAALNAVHQWRFAPARENDTAVASWVVIPIIFKLQG